MIGNYYKITLAVRIGIYSTQHHISIIFAKRHGLFLLHFDELGEFACSVRTLDIVISPHVLVLDKNVGNRALARQSQQLLLYQKSRGKLVDFMHGDIHRWHRIEELLGLCAIGAGRFTPNDDLVFAVFASDELTDFFSTHVALRLR